SREVLLSEGHNDLTVAGVIETCQGHQAPEDTGVGRDIQGIDELDGEIEHPIRQEANERLVYGGELPSDLREIVDPDRKGFGRLECDGPGAVVEPAGVYCNEAGRLLRAEHRY